MVDVEAATAAAQKLADQFASQGGQPKETAAAISGVAENGEPNSNKRKLEDDPEGSDEAMRKRASFNGPEGGQDTTGQESVAARASGFSDAPPSGFSEAPTVGFSDAPPEPHLSAQPTVVLAENPGSGPRMGPTGELQEIIDIPATMVGKLIGKSGETIKHLQNSTGTRVQIDHQLPGEYKKVTISGSSAEAVTACKQQVEQITSDEPSAGDASRSIDCPPGIVGRIIGRGGETIRALQQASQAHIVVDQNYPEGEPRKVNITGKLDSVERATKMVEELITGDPGSAQAIIQKYGAGISKTLDCPKSIVGRVIGKSGETIKTIQKNFGANIQIDQTQEPMKITVAGQPGAVEAAAAAVQEIINGGNPFLGPPGGAGAYGGYGAGFGGPAAYGGFGGYGGYPGYPQAGYGGYPGAYPQAYGAPAYGGYGGYGADPYGGAAAGGYGAGAGGAGASAGGSGLWQELQDEQGRSYYYNTQTGVSQWEKPSDM